MCRVCSLYDYCWGYEPSQPELIEIIEGIKKDHPWEFAQAQMTEHERKFSDAKAKREP